MSMKEMVVISYLLLIKNETYYLINGPLSTSGCISHHHYKHQKRELLSKMELFAH